MPTIQLRTEVSLTQLRQGVQQLDAATLEQFADEVMLRRAKRRAPSLSKDETELFLRINQGLPEATQLRFQALKEKRDDAALITAEYDELLAIIDQIEQRDVERLQALAELAQRHQVSVRQLMYQLGLLPRHDA